MGFFRFFKKQKLIVISAAVAVVTIVTFLAIFSYDIHRNIENETESYLKEIRNNAVFILNNEINQFCESLSNEARSFSLLGEISEQQLIQELADFPKPRAMVRCHIMSLEGKLYSSIDGGVSTVSPKDYEEPLNRTTYGIGDPRYSRTLKRTVVEISTPLYINGKRFGILIGNYDISDFEELFSSNFLEGSCSITIATADGKLMSRTGLTVKPQSLQDDIFDFYFRPDVLFIDGTAEELKNDLKNGRAGYKIYINEGIKRYVSYQPVGIKDWYVAAVSTGKILDAHAETIKRDATRLVIGVVAVMLIATTIIVVYRAKEQESLQNILKKMANTDALTQLNNKAATEMEINAFLKSKGINGKHVFLMIDIDYFKQVNDNLGHEKGDEVLSNFGYELIKICSENTILGRVGGDEFVVFVKNCKSKEDIIELANKICDVLRKTHSSVENVGTQVETSASIGIASYNKDGSTFAELYRNADLALYRSKSSGRNCYTFFSAIT